MANKDKAGTKFTSLNPRRQRTQPVQGKKPVKKAKHGI